MLTSARREYDQQQRLVALAVAQALRAGSKSPREIALTIRMYQAAAITLSLAAIGDQLDEQNIPTAADAAVVTHSFLTDAQALAGMAEQVETPYEVGRLTQTFVQDSSRSVREVDAFTRPAVTRYTRYLTPPSCGRCAILAGRIYRFSTGFARHPKCDCIMQPTNETVGKDLTTTANLDDITDLSKSDRQAIDMGADLNKVVNVRLTKGNLTVGSSVVSRGGRGRLQGRLTPHGCISLADSRHSALDLLKHHGYIL